MKCFSSLLTKYFQHLDIFFDYFEPFSQNVAVVLDREIICSFSVLLNAARSAVAKLRRENSNNHSLISVSAETGLKPEFRPKYRCITNTLTYFPSSHKESSVLLKLVITLGEESRMDHGKEFSNECFPYWSGK